MAISLGFLQNVNCNDFCRALQKLRILFLKTKQDKPRGNQPAPKCA